MEYPKWVLGRIVMNADEEASHRAAVAVPVGADVVEPVGAEPDAVDQPVLPKQTRGRPKKAH